jgi:vancomycin permeability regulator SanA
VSLLQQWARGLSLFLGCMSLVDLATRGELMSWWASRATASWLALSAVVLIAYAMRPAMRMWRRRLTQLVLIALLVRCGVDTALTVRAAATGWVSTPLFPLSLLHGAETALVLTAVTRGGVRPASRMLDGSTVCASAAASALVFAFAQMIVFGATDYRRPADAVVVFGARVYADGTPSLAVADRVRTGAALIRAGYAKRLIVSGGPGDGQVHEAEAMRDLAIAEGVPATAVLLDRGGVDTRATVRNTTAFLGASPRVLAVSHSYHLPRIKLSYQQEGVRAYTVPARESRPLLRLPWYMTRESLAWWAHAFELA